MMDALSTKNLELETPTRHMTWDEWLAWAPDSRITEWVDGEVIEMSPVGDRHDVIFRWLINVLDFYVYKNDLGETRAAPYVLKLANVKRGREPDLMFVAKENKARLHSTYVEGPADAVWEIVSPESVARDRGDKFIEYETEGVREYWLIDPERQQVELYRLGENGRYQYVLPQEGKLVSEVIRGFYVRPEWLWAEPMLRPWEVLPELGIAEM